ncbi:unnamed protein product, partial [Ascophyllum nodosum]
LPYFLGGSPSNEQEHSYNGERPRSKHTAEGEGLYHATVNKRASFTIRLTSENGKPPVDRWNVQHGLFFYVWIANEDQIFTAEVVNEGNGILTATYESSFPGDYLVYVEAIVLSRMDEGRPISGSPFALTISGDPAVDIDGLPTCGTVQEDTTESFWKEGTWVSSNIASSTSGVGRDGWVFQPKTCVHDMFSYDDLMLLASLNEPTWLLVLGGSVQRGLFLTMVDMVLAQGQKDDFDTSPIQKCWGYADVTVGHLRLTYQDMRMFTVTNAEDSLECHNEKLVSGSTADFVQSGRLFLNSTVFGDGHPWPDVIAAPAFFTANVKDPNFAITVLTEALPATWQGTLLMLEHMTGFGNHWEFKNPTRTTLDEIGVMLEDSSVLGDRQLANLETYRRGDRRVEFMSVFPMNQAKLFENQYFRGNRRRKYGRSQHYHYVASSNQNETCSGSRMVFSSITEMLSNIMFAKAVGTKAVLYQRAAGAPGIGERNAAARQSFEVCTDCPAKLFPFHVKSEPQPECETVTTLPTNAPVGEVWNKRLCPAWC